MSDLCGKIVLPCGKRTDIGFPLGQGQRFRRPREGCQDANKACFACFAVPGGFLPAEQGLVHACVLFPARVLLQSKHSIVQTSSTPTGSLVIRVPTTRLVATVLQLKDIQFLMYSSQTCRSQLDMKEACIDFGTAGRTCTAGAQGISCLRNSVLCSCANSAHYRFSTEHHRQPLSYRKALQPPTKPCRAAPQVEGIDFPV